MIYIKGGDSCCKGNYIKYNISNTLHYVTLPVQKFKLKDVPMYIFIKIKTIIHLHVQAVSSRHGQTDKEIKTHMVTYTRGVLH
jgi:hypothetical protein